MKRIFSILMVLMVFVLMSGFAFLAEDGLQFADLSSVLVWFAVGGGAMWLFGIVEARLLENIVFWHKLKPWIKKLVPIAFAGLVGFLAQSLIAVDITQYLPEGVAAILLAAINWYFSQREYGLIKESAYGSSARAG